MLFTRLCLLVLLAGWVSADDAVAATGATATTTTTAETSPPILPPPPPHGPGPFPGGFPGGFPGFPGFHKSLDFGWAPLLAGGGGEGLGGLGQFLGPSYIPSTLFGSALGAKGDFLFPFVIFVFFAVGVWTVIQFLMGLAVPLIATKLAAAGVVEDKIHRFSRSVSGEQTKAETIQHLTNVITAAVSEETCMQKIACLMGNIGHSSGDKSQKEFEQELESLKTSDSNILKVFHSAVTTGSLDCDVYKCSGQKSKPLPK